MISPVPQPSISRVIGQLVITGGIVVVTVSLVVAATPVKGIPASLSSLVVFV
jgi:hypothetical protein